MNLRSSISDLEKSTGDANRHFGAAAEVCFIVTGSNKRDMVTRVMTRERTDVPAAQVTTRRCVRWLLDRDAGTNL